MVNVDPALWRDILAYLRRRHAPICRQWFEELEPLELDEPSANGKAEHAVGDELELSDDATGGGRGGHDLDAEIGDRLEMLDDSTAGEVTLDDEDAPKRARRGGGH
jgi:hypothetical protein